MWFILAFIFHCIILTPICSSIVLLSGQRSRLPLVNKVKTECSLFLLFLYLSTQHNTTPAWNVFSYQPLNQRYEIWLVCQGYFNSRGFFMLTVMATMSQNKLNGLLLNKSHLFFSWLSATIRTCVQAYWTTLDTDSSEQYLLVVLSFLPMKTKVMLIQQLSD